MAEMPTIIETGKNNDNGWGGNAWGAGAGAFIGSMFGNGGFGGWGGYRNAGQVGADVALQTGLQNLSDQVHNNGLSLLQSANGVQQSVSGAAQGITGGIYQNALSNLQGQGATQRQVADTGFAIQGGQYQQTIANLQGQNQQNLAMVQGFGGVGQQICCLGKGIAQDIDATGDQITAAIGVNSQMMADRLCGLNQSVITQGYQGQLQTKDVLTQLQGQHADLKATIIEQGCQDRETMREIAAQAVRDKLAEAQAKIVQLETQNYVNQSNSQQTLYLINQLKPTTTTAAGA